MKIIAADLMKEYGLNKVEAVQCAYILNEFWEKWQKRVPMIRVNGEHLEAPTRLVEWSPFVWADGSPMTPRELRAAAALREAGCRCPVPLISCRGEENTWRCRLCSTRGVKNRGGGLSPQDYNLIGRVLTMPRTHFQPMTPHELVKELEKLGLYVIRWPPKP